VVELSILRSDLANGRWRGWFKLGEPNMASREAVSTKKYVKPTVGKFILFQSYVWHGTNPFCLDQARTTIAFDVARGAAQC